MMQISEVRCLMMKISELRCLAVYSSLVSFSVVVTGQFSVDWFPVGCRSRLSKYVSSCSTFIFLLLSVHVESRPVVLQSFFNLSQPIPSHKSEAARYATETGIRKNEPNSSAQVLPRPAFPALCPSSCPAVLAPNNNSPV